MKLKLVRHHMLSYPELGNVVREEVPLGSEYEIIGFYRECHGTYKGIDYVTDCYLVRNENGTGLMSVEQFGD